MKKIITWLIPPDQWKPAVSVILGIFFGLGLFAFVVSNAVSYVSDDPKACINCHVMNPEYTNWYHNAHGRVTTCNDCHVPHENVFAKYMFKATDGLNHATKFTFRMERQNIIMEEGTRPLIQKNCLRCHDHVVNKSYLRSVLPNYKNHLEERYCLDCHRQEPHGTVKGLASVPNALVSRETGSRVASWIQETEK
ncbi:MAG: cytochrome c nitrite reductase small subunit [Syntrophothermus sp.]